MLNQQKLIRVTKNIINNFVKEWRKSPYEWETEMDIHAEIYNRLVREFEKQNWLKMRLKYDDVKDERFTGRSQTYRRIGCKPKTYFKYKGKRIIRYPDIVIYSDIPDPDNPPDKTKDINFPMFLTIEIKYQTEWSGDWNPYNKKVDVAKMKWLIKQANDKTINGTRYAWCLNFYRPKDKTAKVERHECI